MIKILDSFNEKKVQVLFDEVPHTYIYNNAVLTSATGIVEKYGDTFDLERVSFMSSQKWNESQDDILALWDSNGQAAAGFGTAIHKVIEHYFTYKTIGARIQKVSGKKHNAAIPNHPFLQKLLYELEAIRQDGNTRQEVFISSVKNGICGLVDDLLILDPKKKICRIRDYKITADILVDKSKLAAPFSYLGANKLSKNFLQLCIYACMLQLSGWKIDGIDIFNWNGEWKKYTMDSKDMGKTILLVASELCTVAKKTT